MAEPINSGKEKADGSHLLLFDMAKACPRILAELPALAGAEMEQFGFGFACHVGWNLYYL